jgi:hypothetical protein
MLVYVSPVAEQTSSYDIPCDENVKLVTNDTMSSAILTANFPTLVPPYFCTSHLADGSMVFWCKFGGVRGGGVPEEDEEELGGSDMLYGQESLVHLGVVVDLRFYHSPESFE